MVFLKNIREGFAADSKEELDNGDLVQTVIITAGFAVAGFLIINWISTALINKGAEISNCIEGSSNFKTTAANSANCQKTYKDLGGTSYKSDSGYTGRGFKNS